MPSAQCKNCNHSAAITKDHAAKIKTKKITHSCRKCGGATFIIETNKNTPRAKAVRRSQPEPWDRDETIRAAEYQVAASDPDFVRAQKKRLRDLE